MLKILHSSDLHGRYKLLLRDHAETAFDLWLDTGDFFDNVGRVPKTSYQIIPEIEATHQQRWWGWKKLGARFAEWLDGRPAIIMPGNHDFVSLYLLLKQAGVDAHLVTPGGVEVAGLKWAGFREVQQVNATKEWMGEISPLEADATFRALVEQTWAADPDVLVTHTPASGILNGRGPDYGVPALTRHLMYCPHNIRWHFFGHDHENGGDQLVEAGIRFHNGATFALLHDLEIGVASGKAPDGE